MRKLVTKRTILEILPIEGSDFIELARIDGWQCVVKKDSFKKGDKCVYFEIDSMLPCDDERFAFLDKAKRYKIEVEIEDAEGNKEKVEKEFFRIKTMKLRGALSQGLALPISDFPELHDNLEDKERGYEADLDVEKYEPGKSGRDPNRIKMGPMNACGPFPYFVPKTDQERIQNCFGLMKSRFEDKDFEATLKLDGSSCTLFCVDGNKFDLECFHKDYPSALVYSIPYRDQLYYVGVCSRNWMLKYDVDNRFWKAIIRDNLHMNLMQTCHNQNGSFAIQGELMGPGIQGNKEGFEDYQFFAFDVYDIDKQEYLNYIDRHNFCDGVKCQHVPSVWDYNKNDGKFESLNDGYYCASNYLKGVETCDDFLNKVDGIKSINHEIGEGVVFKMVSDPSISFKAISNSFLLKEK